MLRRSTKAVPSDKCITGSFLCYVTVVLIRNTQEVLCSVTEKKLDIYIFFYSQKLPENVLGKLGLEKSKTRYLPLHLHGRQMILPGKGSQPEIIVSCPMPKHFTKTLGRLGLVFPDEKDLK